MKTIRFTVTKDYPTVNGMLHKNDVVMIEEKYKSFIREEIIKVRDLTGKIWFVETKYLKQI